MIDLHCHMLPGIDDGAADLEVSVEMARIAVADGISITVCTPHILATVYNNTGPQILAAVGNLQDVLNQAKIPLLLLAGADVHIAPDLVAGLHSGKILSLAGTRYLLFEPSHHVMPLRLDDCIFDLMTAGYIPILTHPERLAWIDRHYDAVERLAGRGMLLQITSGSLTGHFGRRAQHWAYRMLDDGLVDILATDAHDLERRPPRLSEGRRLVEQRYGAEEAARMVFELPRAVLRNVSPSQLPPRPNRERPETAAQSGWRLALDRVMRR